MHCNAPLLCCCPQTLKVVYRKNIIIDGFSICLKLGISLQGFGNTPIQKIWPFLQTACKFLMLSCKMQAFYVGQHSLK